MAWLWVWAILLGTAVDGPGGLPYEVGFAKVDVTPTKPIRLSGYSGRDLPSAGVESKLWVRAMALRKPAGPLFVVVSVETIGLPGALTMRVFHRVEKPHGLTRERLVLCSTHSHTSPQLAGGIKNILRKPETPEEVKTTDEYTRRLEDAIVEAVDKAAANLTSASISFGESRAGFGVHRRVIKKGQWAGFGVNPDGPIDRSVPFLRVSDKQGRVRGFLVNYACHATTLVPEFNQVSGDWPGYSMDELERRHPSAVALSVIGCAGDVNPQPRGKLEHVRPHGIEIADAVDNTPADKTISLIEAPTGKFGYAGLAPERPSTSDLTKRLRDADVHVRRNAADLLGVAARMGRLPETYPCPIHVWGFGDELTMVFLGGEVVTEYAQRLKKELPAKHTWVTAYSDDVFGYVASERMRAEKGYEFDYSAVYYGLPGPWLSGTEDLLIRRVHEISKSAVAEGALSPSEAVKSFRLPDDLEIQLVASEPLIVDPVNFDFGADGRLWVVEMRDYPRGLDGKGKPGGRIKVLEDRDRDGVFDHATVFLDGLSYPNGVACWRDGVLITAAPNLLYAVDENGDGKADKTQVLFTGFAEANPQHRVSGFSYGLDGWFYIGGEGLGSILSKKTGKQARMSGRDARIDPDRGLIDPVNGQTQFGRARDDWGNWFGGNNSIPIWQYLFPDRYGRRNPHAPAPAPWVAMMEPVHNPPVYPASRTVDRFNDLHTANRFTSACSPAIYRDELLGREYSGSAFICEPVHNLVHRAVLESDGIQLKGVRSAADKSSEFLASTDTWSRPVHVVTGPDGAIWVADMYRQVIEHPQWIPEAWQERLNVRAGEDKGRIYRVYPKGRRPGPSPILHQKSSTLLASLLESPNGTLRDAAQRLILERGRPDVVSSLVNLLDAPRPQARLHALWTLQGLGSLKPDHVQRGVNDKHPGVRENALQLAEQFLAADPRIGEALVKASSDSVRAVRFQSALSLGEWNDPQGGKALGRLAVERGDDPWIRAAVLSSSVQQPEAILSAVLAGGRDSKDRSDLAESLIATTIGVRGKEGLRKLLAEILPTPSGPIEEWRFAAFASLLDALGRRNQSLDSAAASSVLPQVRRLLAEARQRTADEEAPLAARQSAVRLLGRGLEGSDADFEMLAKLVGPRIPTELRSAAVETLSRSKSPRTPEILLAGWKGYSPNMRGEVLDCLMSRPEWTQALLAAVTANTVSAGDVDAARRDRLVRHPRADLRESAGRLFIGGLGNSQSRRKVMEEHQEVLSTAGNPLRGSVVFARVCASCHQFRGRGAELGPALASLKDKSNEVLLTAVLDPNRAVESRYLSYTATTTDGRILAGLVVAETSSSITLARPDGGRDVLLRIDVEDFVSSGKSFMPEGMEKDLSKRDMADLFSFLRTTSPTDSKPSVAEVRKALDQLVESQSTANPQWDPSMRRRGVTTWIGTRQAPFCGAGGADPLAWELPAAAAQASGAKRLLRLPVVMGGLSSKSGAFELALNGNRLLEFAGAAQDAAWTSADGRAKAFFLCMQHSADQASGLLDVELASELLVDDQPLRFTLRTTEGGAGRWFGLVPTAP